MDSREFLPNSHKSKMEQANSPIEKKHVEKVVKGTVKTKNRSGVRKFTDNFISEDARNVKSYVVGDVLIPAIKKTIFDMVTNGLDMIFFSGNARRSRGTTNAGFVSYTNYSNRNNERRASESRYGSAYNHKDIVLETRGEAEEVIARMDELIDTYGMVSVADLYDLVGEPCNYTDNKYGWRNIRNAEPIRVHDGYLLKLPKVGPID